MIERETMSGAATAIMPDQVKALETERAHQIELIASHRAEGIIRSVGKAARLGRVAITPQIGADDGMARRQFRRHARPHRLVLRKAVQQQNGRTRSADDARYFGLAHADLSAGKAFKHYFRALPSVSA